MAKDFLRLEENQITSIELKLKNANYSDEVANQLKESLGDQFKVQTKAQLNAIFYKVINTENLVSYLIFTLIINLYKDRTCG